MSSTRSRLGFYYSSDDRLYSRSALEIILPALDSVKAGWLVLRGSAARAIPEEFLAALHNKGIEPIIHMPISVGETGAQELQSLMTAYGQWNVKHVVVFDRPNQKSSWAEGQWNHSNLVERFAEHLIPVLEMQVDAGLVPVLPALEPGGDYWDLAFLETLLSILDQRLDPTVKDQLKLGIYNWVNEKPLDWGSGGPSSWPTTRPYHTPPGSQDHLGFRIFEWYAAVTKKVFGHTLPMLVISGGTVTNTPETITRVDRNLEINLSITRMLQDESLPSYLENFAFSYFYAPDASGPSRTSWISSHDQYSPALVALQRLVRQGYSKQPVTDAKRYPHYLLLPSNHQHQAMLAWAEIGPYVIEHQPLVGFSIEEAMLAHHVTLAGDESVIPSSISADLSAAGCKVDRYTSPIRYQQTGSATPHSSIGAPQE
jgi:hypothetical protein